VSSAWRRRSRRAPSSHEGHPPQNSARYRARTSVHRCVWLPRPVRCRRGDVGSTDVAAAHAHQRMARRQSNPGTFAARGTRLELFTVEPLMEVKVRHRSRRGATEGPATTPTSLAGHTDQAIGRTAYLAWVSNNAALGVFSDDRRESHTGRKGKGWLASTRDWEFRSYLHCCLAEPTVAEG